MHKSRLILQALNDSVSLIKDQLQCVTTPYQQLDDLVEDSKKDDMAVPYVSVHGGKNGRTGGFSMLISFVAQKAITVTRTHVTTCRRVLKDVSAK